MSRAYQCRGCKGPPLREEESNGWIENGRAMSPCPNCHGFYRAIPVNVELKDGDAAERVVVKDGEPATMADILRARGKDTNRRIVTGWAGLDWVTGGGLPVGKAIFICGNEGSGKTTFLMELFRHLAAQKLSSLFVSAEQSREDLADEFVRMGKFPETHMEILDEPDAESIIEAIRKSGAKVAAIDSIHAVEGVIDSEGFEKVTGHTGALSQLGRELKKVCSAEDVTLFVVGHLNANGELKGGTDVRHMLDANLRLDRGGDEDNPRRVLRFERKVRFAPLGRRALFKMTDTGITDCGPFVGTLA